MFEREFEFTVNQPLEVCEERILDMQKTGFFVSNPISTYIAPCDSDGDTKFYVSFTGQHARVKGSIKSISKLECGVSGVAYIEGFEFLLMLTLIAAVLPIYKQVWWLVGLVALTCLLIWLISIHHRNRLIYRLEKALNQPKKKNQ
jgi:hypothetical protein